MVRPNEWTEFLDEVPGMEDLRLKVVLPNGEVLFDGPAAEVETGHYACSVLLDEEHVGEHIYLLWYSAESEFSNVSSALLAGTSIQADVLKGYAQEA